MAILDLLTSGGIGTALGAVGALTEKFLTQKLQNAHQIKEWDHIRQMHQLQMSADQEKADQELMITQMEGDYKSLNNSITHDTEIHKKTSQWVSNSLAFFRPGLAVGLTLLAYSKPEIYTGFAGMAIAWFFGSRSGHIERRQ